MIERMTNPSEDEIHISLAQHIALRAMPGVVAFHIANQGKRSKSAGAKLKKMGICRHDRHSAFNPRIMARYCGSGGDLMNSQLMRPFYRANAMHSAASAIPRRQMVKIADIVRIISVGYGVTAEEIRSQSKTRRLIRPRQMVFFLAFEFSLQGSSVIGRQIGDRDHSTVLHGRARIATLSENDQFLRDDIDVCRTILNSIKISPDAHYLQALHFKPWQLKEYADLTRYFDEGLDAHQISMKLGRAVSTVRKRILDIRRARSDAPKLWASGLDTRSITWALRLPNEAIVANSLPKIKLMARGMR